MRTKKKLSWLGYCVCSSKDMLFQNVRMYDKPPMANDPIGIKSGPATDDEFSIKQIREYDLLIMSEEEIDLRGGDDIKRVSNVNFLRSLLFQHNAMFGFVKQKASKTNGNFVLLQVDISKSYFLDRAESENTFTKLHCYHFENLSTTVREFKTLKMSEFFKMAPIILNPSLALTNKEEMLKRHKKEIELSIGKIEAEEKVEPLKFAKNVVHMDDP